MVICVTPCASRSMAAEARIGWSKSSGHSLKARLVVRTVDALW